MIQQPDLGKKIADLRKSKGLTQEELVDKCNLSVRTLQRIEAGEVTPRPITVRLIFEALEVPFDESMNNKGFLTKWLEQFYIRFLDFFNLKTKTMKKILTLTVMFSTIIVVASAISRASFSGLPKWKEDNKSEEFLPANDMVFTNFSCDNCFEENGVLIGHGVSFKINGIHIIMDLIKIDKATKEFNCGFIKGKLFENKVELTCPEDLVNSESIQIAADKIEKLEDKMILKGKASIKSTEGDVIEADEIIIVYI